MNITIDLCIFESVEGPISAETENFDLLEQYFWSKRDRVNTTIEFCIFDLVNVPNVKLN